MPEPDTMHLCSNRSSIFTGLLLTICLWASQPAIVFAQATAPAAAPESQKPLNVDRDPVRSPDAEGSAPAPAANGKGTELSKEGGRFTLHKDVDEVILNVTVLDDSNHLVDT